MPFRKEQIYWITYLFRVFFLPFIWTVKIIEILRFFFTNLHFLITFNGPVYGILRNTHSPALPLRSFWRIYNFKILWRFSYPDAVVMISVNKTIGYWSTTTKLWSCVFADKTIYYYMYLLWLPSGAKSPRSDLRKLLPNYLKEKVGIWKLIENRQNKPWLMCECNEPFRSWLRWRVVCRWFRSSPDSESIKYSWGYTQIPLSRNCLPTCIITRDVSNSYRKEIVPAANTCIISVILFQCSAFPCPFVETGVTLYALVMQFKILIAANLWNFTLNSSHAKISMSLMAL